MSELKQCFVIAPIGEHDSKTRIRSDKVLRHIIKPAVKERGYEAVRADEIDQPGIITSQVIQHVIDDPLVIADLTERNPNVFYELAIRHAACKPFVQLMNKGEQIPFDVAGTRTIFFDLSDPDSVADAKIKIVDQISELEKNPSDIETPISVSRDLQILRQSDKPEDRSLAELVAALTTIRLDLGDFEAKIDSQTNRIEEINMMQKIIRNHSIHNTMPIGFSRRVNLSMMEDLFKYINSDVQKMFILVSSFRDVLPWLFEMGKETYRVVESENDIQALKYLHDFRNTIQFIQRSKYVSDYINRDEDETQALLERIIFHVDQIIETTNNPIPF
ncbi:MAG: hypothetical protein OXH90_05010 [Paracoccaceae bacterium]|nr:hypothetical protein [Paracoccaceae bacterium]MDE2917028.1 hypothetical protein [Paracoccaceae bacterium]